MVEGRRVSLVLDPPVAAEGHAEIGPEVDEDRTLEIREESPAAEVAPPQPEQRPAPEQTQRVEGRSLSYWLTRLRHDLALRATGVDEPETVRQLLGHLPAFERHRISRDTLKDLDRIGRDPDVSQFVTDVETFPMGRRHLAGYLRYLRRVAEAGAGPALAALAHAGINPKTTPGAIWGAEEKSLTLLSELSAQPEKLAWLASPAGETLVRGFADRGQRFEARDTDAIQAILAIGEDPTLVALVADPAYQLHQHPRDFARLLPRLTEPGFRETLAGLAVTGYPVGEDRVGFQSERHIEELARQTELRAQTFSAETNALVAELQQRGLAPQLPTIVALAPRASELMAQLPLIDLYQRAGIPVTLAEPRDVTTLIDVLQATDPATLAQLKDVDPNWAGRLSQLAATPPSLRAPEQIQRWLAAVASPEIGAALTHPDAAVFLEAVGRTLSLSDLEALPELVPQTGTLVPFFKQLKGAGIRQLDLNQPEALVNLARDPRMTAALGSPRLARLVDQSQDHTRRWANEYWDPSAVADLPWLAQASADPELMRQFDKLSRDGRLKYWAERWHLTNDPETLLLVVKHKAALTELGADFEAAFGSGHTFDIRMGGPGADSGEHRQNLRLLLTYPHLAKDVFARHAALGADFRWEQLGVWAGASPEALAFAQQFRVQFQLEGIRWPDSWTSLLQLLPEEQARATDRYARLRSSLPDWKLASRAEVEFLRDLPDEQFAALAEWQTLFAHSRQSDQLVSFRQDLALLEQLAREPETADHIKSIASLMTEATGGMRVDVDNHAALAGIDPRQVRGVLFDPAYLPQGSFLKHHNFYSQAILEFLVELSRPGIATAEYMKPFHALAHNLPFAAASDPDTWPDLETAATTWQAADFDIRPAALRFLSQNGDTKGWEALADPRLSHLPLEEPVVARTIFHLITECVGRGGEIGSLINALTTPNGIGLVRRVASDGDLRRWAARHFEKLLPLPPEKFDVYVEVVSAIEGSVSQEMQRHKEQITDLIFSQDDPIGAYHEVAAIFEHNHLPTVGKVLKVFEALHPPAAYKETMDRSSSAVLRSGSERVRHWTVYRDLLKVHIESANPSLRTYLEMIAAGQAIADRADQASGSGFDGLPAEEREALRYWLDQVDTMLLSSERGERQGVAPRGDPTDLAGRYATLRNDLGCRPDQSIEDRVAEMFVRPLGYESLPDVFAAMDGAKRTADARNRAFAREAGQEAIRIVPGDVLKGVGGEYIRKILENGSVAKEFLGTDATSDSTPLDTDVSLVLASDVVGDTPSGRFEAVFSTSLAKDYGSLLLLIRDRGQWQKTEKSQPTREDRGKYELFPAREVDAARHYGVRTGFPATEIDAIIADHNFVADWRALRNLKMEIAKNGYYLPIVDRSGQVIFSEDEYAATRRIYAGLDRFDADPIAFIEVSGERQPALRAALDELIERSRGSAAELGVVTENLGRELRAVLREAGVELKSPFNPSWYGAELLDTGSTSRRTNLPGDQDFDLTLKLDARDSRRSGQIYDALRAGLRPAVDASHSDHNYYQVRTQGVEIAPGTRLDIDIGLTTRSELAEFGSHDAVGEKLASIAQHSGEAAHEEVIAHILLAKLMLKQAGAYKRLEHGGFGGIGVENWILGHNGSLVDAAQNFVAAARGDGRDRSFEEFKKVYQVVDSGINTKFNNHDNFILNMEARGYDAMLLACKDFLATIDEPARAPAYFRELLEVLPKSPAPEGLIRD